MYKIFFRILRECLPLIFMVALIPCVYNDYVLTVVYFVSGIILILAKNKQHDWLVYGVGLVAMTFFEFIFIQTGVEVFQRNSLFDLMPLWLPFLWAYGFVVMKRSIVLLMKIDK